MKHSASTLWELRVQSKTGNTLGKNGKALHSPDQSFGFGSFPTYVQPRLVRTSYDYLLILQVTSSSTSSTQVQYSEYPYRSTPNSSTQYSSTE